MSAVSSIANKRGRGRIVRYGVTCDVETDCRNHLDAWLLRIPVASTATILMALTPVEEPSTAS